MHQEEDETKMVSKELALDLEGAAEAMVRALRLEGFVVFSRLDVSHGSGGFTLIRACYPREAAYSVLTTRTPRDAVHCNVILRRNGASCARADLMISSWGAEAVETGFDLLSRQARAKMVSLLGRIPAPLAARAG